jgi:hypothetical protein
MAVAVGVNSCEKLYAAVKAIWSACTMKAECVVPLGSWSAERPMLATALPALTLMYHSAAKPVDATGRGRHHLLDGGRAAIEVVQPRGDLQRIACRRRQIVRRRPQRFANARDNLSDSRGECGLSCREALAGALDDRVDRRIAAPCFRELRKVGQQQRLDAVAEAIESIRVVDARRQVLPQARALRSCWRSARRKARSCCPRVLHEDRARACPPR